jgi:polysaccharide biosynthesis/export protein
MRKTVLALIAAVLFMLLSPQPMAQVAAGPAAARPPRDGSPAVHSSPSASAVAARGADLIIASGDLLDISVFGTDFFKETRVGGMGEISLPLVGSVKVAGLTVAQAEQAIAARLSQERLFNDPQVTIVQKEFSTQGISVMGEVQKPSIYPLLGPHTLLEAISAAGGTTVKAGNDVSILHRDQPNQAQHVNLTEPRASNVPVFAGDTIVVSKAGIVYVVGDVHQPSGVVMESSGLTVLKAIAMAQGTNPTASLDSAKLIRNTPHGKQEIAIPLKRILANKAPDPELRPEDILFVPSSAAKSATRRGLEAILQAATGVAIYRR